MALGAASRWMRVASACIALLIAAQLPGLAQPSSVQPGVIERGQEKQQKPASTRQIAIPEVTAPAPDTSFDQIRLTLKAVVIEGNTAIDTATLQATFNELIGREVSLAQIFAATQTITRLYAERGYALSLAYLPAQEIEDGTVKVRVVEGYVETVEVVGDGAALAATLEGFGAEIKASRPLRTATLERYLLLANDLPGMRVRSVIDKGSGAAGAMKLILRVDRHDWDASATLDNRGTQALGPARASASASINGLITGRESIALSYMTGAESDELDYWSGSVSYVIGHDGLVLSAEGSNTDSRPGTADLAAVDFRTTGVVATGKAFYPIIRSRAENLFADVSFTYKDLHGDILGVTNSDDHLSVVALTGHYDLLDAWDGISAIDATVSQGLDIFDATRVGDPDPSRVGADAMFTRIEVSASRVQALTSSLELSLGVMGQYADSALLSSEQCGFGGARFGRAFDSFEIAGDHCVMGSAELRYTLPPPGRVFDNFQVYAFADAGEVWRRGEILPGEFSQAGRQSAGAGLRFSMWGRIDGSVEYANPLGDDVALEGDASGRVFFAFTVHR